MSSLSYLSTFPLLLHQSPSSTATTSPAKRVRASCSNSGINSNATNTYGGGGSGDSDGERRGESPRMMDRRNVLLGIGGLCGGAAGLNSGSGNIAIGAPIEIPDLSLCHDVDDPQCCPNYPIGEIIDYQFPSPSKPMRIRKPAHQMTTQEIENYERAVQLWRNLDSKDPRSYMNFANVHCLFCGGGYYQRGYEYEQLVLDIHDGWLFLPWHRFYVHFLERILGSLIGDEFLAIPYWNWDTKDGMYMPDIFTKPTSPLYDEKRNINHFPPALLNFHYSHFTPNPSTEAEIDETINCNLAYIHKIYKESIHCPFLFIGGPVRQGSTTPTSDGKLEGVHNTIHNWSGPDQSPYMDMGIFATAARDPLFFSHHSNVDRMWEIYRKKRNYRPETEDHDWLDASFVFVDENKQFNRVKVKQSLDCDLLRYAYKDVPRPWEKPHPCKTVVQAQAKALLSGVSISEFGSNPRTLDSIIRVLVPRPEAWRTKEEKKSACKVLVISGIEDIMEPSRFDVYVRAHTDSNEVGHDLGEFAGSYVRVPHGGKGKMKMSKLKLGITYLLEDLKAEAAKELVVSLVPRMGEIRVGGVDIQLENTDNESPEGRSIDKESPEVGSSGEFGGALGSKDGKN